MADVVAPVDVYMFSGFKLVPENVMANFMSDREISTVRGVSSLHGDECLLTSSHQQTRNVRPQIVSKDGEPNELRYSEWIDRRIVYLQSFDQFFRLPSCPVHSHFAALGQFATSWRLIRWTARFGIFSFVNSLRSSVWTVSF